MPYLTYTCVAVRCVAYRSSALSYHTRIVCVCGVCVDLGVAALLCTRAVLYHIQGVPEHGYCLGMSAWIPAKVIQVLCGRPVVMKICKANNRQSQISSFCRIQGGSNMTGTNCDLFTHKSSPSYLNHLVYLKVKVHPRTGHKVPVGVSG